MHQRPAAGLLIGILILAGCKTADTGGSESGKNKNGLADGPGLGSSLSALNPFAAKTKVEVPAGPTQAPEPSKQSAGNPRPTPAETIAKTNAATTAKAALKQGEKTPKAKKPDDPECVATETVPPKKKRPAKEALAMQSPDGPPLKATTSNALKLVADGQPLASNRLGTGTSLSLANHMGAEKAGGVSANLPDAGAPTARQPSLKTPLTLRLSDWIADDAAHQAWRQKHLEKLGQTDTAKAEEPKPTPAPEVATLTRYVFNPKTGEMEKVEAPASK